MIEKLAQFTDVRCCLIVGGLSSKVRKCFLAIFLTFIYFKLSQLKLFHCLPQIQEVALRSMPDIVVATPGRIIDHLRNTQSVGLEDLAVLILDEADRLLELGFSQEIQEIVFHLPHLLSFCCKRISFLINSYPVERSYTLLILNDLIMVYRLMQIF